MNRIFITGGAGYIGSHAVKMLGEQGHQIVVYDNLSSGHKEFVLYGDLVVGDLSDRNLLNQTIRDFKPDAVLHFAASIEVEESMRMPLKYYLNNTGNTLRLLDAMLQNRIKVFLFSSTAALYGEPVQLPITELESIKPNNPYAQSKAFVEKVLEDISTKNDFRYVSLRYFNAAGADPEGRIGERHNPETHLIPLLLKTANGERQTFKIYGTDYPTPDGTCIRDYIHVDDLANAHVLAVRYLFDKGKSDIFNCGYGHGYSVREIVDTAKRVTNVNFPVEEAGRRAGDTSVLISDSSKIRRELHWEPKYDDLEYIIKTSWEWEQKIGRKKVSGGPAPQ